MVRAVPEGGVTMPRPPLPIGTSSNITTHKGTDGYVAPRMGR